MNISKSLFSFTLLVTPTLSFAFFCPSNFNQIDYGNSPEQVVQQCGKPDKESFREVKPEGPQEWSYYVPQAVATQNSGTTQGTLKTQVTFDENGKAINISVNGIGVGSSTICGNTIQLGDTRDSIKAVCGNPSFISKAEPSTNGGVDPLQITKITEFTYNSNPPVTLVFENGILKEKR